MGSQLRDSLRVLSAEFFATLILVFLGCGAISSAYKRVFDITVNRYPIPPSDVVANLVPWPPAEGLSRTAWDLDIVQISLSFGFAYGVVVFVFSHVSGALVNPALVLALVATRKMGVVQGIYYILVQMVGAITGAAILDSVTGRSRIAHVGATVLGQGVSPGEGFGLEAVITFIYVLVVFAVGKSERIAAGSLRDKSLVIAIATALLNFMALPFSGASFNPARSFGPAVVSGVWTNHWVYWVGPFVGGVLAGLLNETWFNASDSFLPVHSTKGVSPKPTPADHAPPESVANSSV